MSGKKTNYNNGDLVRIIRHGTMSLALIKSDKGAYIREMPTKDLETYTHPKYENIIEHIEGKCGLVVYVSNNKLGQPLGYRILLEGRELFCKAVIANKYLELVGATHHESGGPSEI
tara:strand:+ start:112 stop:459 length:348 start_codon:yes stop_codon:yes gene_type:complete